MIAGRTAGRYVDTACLEYLKTSVHALPSVKFFIFAVQYQIIPHRRPFQNQFLYTVPVQIKYPYFPYHHFLNIILCISRHITTKVRHFPGIVSVKYGIAIILFSLAIKVVLFPLSLKGKKSMIQMNMLSVALPSLSSMV